MLGSCTGNVRKGLFLGTSLMRSVPVQVVHGTPLFLLITLVRAAKELHSRQSPPAARKSAREASCKDVINMDIEEDPLQAAAREIEEVRQAARDDLKRFDELLKKRSRGKDIDKGKTGSYEGSL
jgi:hypothetical protein